MDVLEVDRIRLFSSGKELEDSRSLSGMFVNTGFVLYFLELASLATHTGFAPVHVTVVSKAARQAAIEAAREEAKSAVGCQCTVM
jgi:hypothetical protein